MNTPPDSLFNVVKVQARRFAVAWPDGEIARCQHDGITGGIQLIYTSQARAEHVVEWLNKNPDSVRKPEELSNL